MKPNQPIFRGAITPGVKTNLNALRAVQAVRGMPDCRLDRAIREMGLTKEGADWLHGDRVVLLRIATGQYVEPIPHALAQMEQQEVEGTSPARVHEIAHPRRVIGPWQPEMRLTGWNVYDRAELWPDEQSPGGE